MMQTRVRFGVLTKWKQTMYQPGLKVVRLQLKTVRCYVRHIIEQKEIDRNLSGAPVFNWHDPPSPGLWQGKNSAGGGPFDFAQNKKRGRTGRISFSVRSRVGQGAGCVPD